MDFLDGMPPGEAPKPPLYEDPLLLQAAENDRILRSNLEALRVAEDFVARAPDNEAYRTIRDTMDSKVREDIARIGYVTSQQADPPEGRP